jgi:hypothetical protein
VFELKLQSFLNLHGKDAQGHCCEGYRTARGKCSGRCSTKFRVCLKHYQANIDPSNECTFGEFVTPVLGNNVANYDPIRFPIDFKWPVRKKEHCAKTMFISHERMGRKLCNHGWKRKLLIFEILHAKGRRVRLQLVLSLSHT